MSSLDPNAFEDALRFPKLFLPLSQLVEVIYFKHFLKKFLDHDGLHNSGHGDV